MTKEQYKAELLRRSEAGLFPSYDPEAGTCLYRGPNGTACGVGIAIPGSDPVPFESKSIYDDDVYYAIDPELRGQVSRSVFERIQYAHDIQVDDMKDNPNLGWNHDNFAGIVNEVLP